MLKRTMAFLLTAVMIATLGTGCAKKDLSAISGGSPVTLNGSKIYPLQCDDTLTYWTTLQASLSTKYQHLGETPFGKELEKRTGVKIEYMHPTQGQGTEQFQIMLTSDDLPDLVKYAWNSYPGGPQKAIDDEYIYNLNDIIDEYAPAFKKVLKGNEFYAKSVKNDEGNYYSFPFLLEEGILQTFIGPVIREDWLKKAGLQSPETISEWETVLTSFKEDFGARAPISVAPANLLSAFGSAFNVFSNWYINDKKVVYGPMEPGYKDYLEKMKQWYEKGFIDQDFAGINGKTIRAQILNGDTGVVVDYAGGGIGDMMKAMESDKEFSVTGAKFPSPEKGKKAEYGNLSSIVNIGQGTGISRNCENVELAARFLDYGYTEEGHDFLNFGVEGISYDMVDGYPTYTKDITDNPDGLTMSEAMDMYMQSGYSGSFVQDTRYIEQYYKLPQQKNAQKAWMETNMAEHLIPQIYIDVNKSDEDSDIMAAVKTYIDEMTVKFITGRESLDDYDKFINQLKEFGIEKAIANRQEAYEKYLNR